MDLHDFPAFRGLSKAQVDAVLQLCTEVSLRDGEKLIVQGQPVRSIYFVYEGRVRVSVKTQKGEQELAASGAPCVIGEVELFSGEASVATVTAAEPSRALALMHDKFRKMAERGDEALLRISHNIAKLLASRLAMTDQKIIGILDGTMPETKELAVLKKKLFGEWSI
jgi:CRP/FNR family transcriptional regulator, cyclic AMP receptor protein